MKKKIVVIVTLLLLAAFVAMPLSALAQPPSPTILYTDEAAAQRAQEIAITTTIGDCEKLPTPTPDGSPRNMTLNEDTTKIVAYFDEKHQAVCVRVWGSWPGTTDGNGVSEFDSDFKVLVGTGVVNAQDKPLIRSNPNPAKQGIPYHDYFYQVPCGGNTQFLVLINFYQQQVLGVQRLGMPHRDWSGSFRNEICNLWIPWVSRVITFTPTPTSTPTVTPSCPIWKADITTIQEGKNTLQYTFGGANPGKLLHMYQDQVTTIRIYGNGGVPADLETSLTGPDKTVEYGRATSITLSGLGLYTYHIESSFHSNGQRCWWWADLWDPKVLAANLTKLYPQLNTSEIDNLVMGYGQLLEARLKPEDAYKILINTANNMANISQ